MEILVSDILIITVLIIVLYFLIFRQRLTASEGGLGGLSTSTSWWSMSLFILSANVGLDYFIGGAGQGYKKGIAIGSYEWTGIIFMIVALLFIFPKIMSPGIKTTPEYLGYRYGKSTRTIVAILMVFLHLGASLIPILYSAAKTLQSLYGYDFLLWLVGIGGSVLLILLWGRFDFLIRLNVILVIVMLAASIVVMFCCIVEVGGIEPLVHGAREKFDSTLPSTDDFLPWQTVFFGGLWVAHAYYWCFNQFIIQSSLQSNTLSKAQYAYLFAATMKLIVPFLVLIPGIAGYVLFGNSLDKADQVFMVVWSTVVPPKISGLLMAGYLTSVLATYSAIVYACISILVNDLYPIKWTNTASSYVTSYRYTLVVILSVSVTGAYLFNEYITPNMAMFKYNQFIMNTITPPLVAVFILGMFVRFITTIAANTALILSLPFYVLLQYQYPDMDLLNVGGVVFLICCALMLIISRIFPEKEYKVIPDVHNMAFERNIGVVTWSIFLITIVVSIYVVF